MSLYNAINGFNIACVFFLPMLGMKQEEYPRFRDCFISKDEQRIVIYTRVGGNNRNQGYGEEKLYQNPNFVCTYDDDFDDTYGSYEFNPPTEWENDFRKLLNGDFVGVSDKYYQHVKDFFPLLAEKGIIDKLFCRNKEAYIEP